MTEYFSEKFRKYSYIVIGVLLLFICAVLFVSSASALPLSEVVKKNANVYNNYTLINETYYNSTGVNINESYAYLPGRNGGQTLTGGGASGNLILNGSMANGNIYINPNNAGTIYLGNSVIDQLAVGQNAGKLTYVTSQVALGNNAGYNNSGTYQSAIGFRAGYKNTNADQIAIGHFSGQENSGINEIAIGQNAGYRNTGDYVISVGRYAGRENTGANSIFIGYNAGYLNTKSGQFQINQTNVNPKALMSGDFASGTVKFDNYNTGICSFNSTGSISSQPYLAGVKTYYVSDTLGGNTTRKLTFTNGILTGET